MHRKTVLFMSLLPFFVASSCKPGPKDELKCTEGFELKDGQCTDIDECESNHGGCGDAGFFMCTNNTGAPPTCVDIDECATNNGNCDPAFYTCTNNTGAPPTCVDIDECATNNGGCAPQATCTNTVGSRICECNNGYSGDGIDCGAILCDANFLVSNHACAPCPPGTTNNANDDASGSDTTCEKTLCAENEFVMNHECKPCPPGSTHRSETSAAGENTECLPNLYGQEVCNGNSCELQCHENYTFNNGVCRPECNAELDHCDFYEDLASIAERTSWCDDYCNLGNYAPYLATSLQCYRTEIYDRTTQDLITCGIATCFGGYHPTYRGERCVPNTATMCGSERMDCEQNAATATCGPGGLCDVETCLPGFEIITDNAGHKRCARPRHSCAEDLDCELKIPLAKASVCRGGICFVDTQQAVPCNTDTNGARYHPGSMDLGCDKNTVDACGSWQTSCTTMANAVTAQCEQGQCISTKCSLGYHLAAEGRCVADSLSECGQEGLACSGPTGATLECITTTIGAPAECAASCPIGTHLSGSSCITDSLTNCGAAGKICDETLGTNEQLRCALGVCLKECAAGYEWNDTVDSCTAAVSGCGSLPVACDEVYGDLANCSSGICLCAEKPCDCGNGICDVSDGETSSNCIADCETPVFYRYHNNRSKPFRLRLEQCMENASNPALDCFTWDGSQDWMRVRKRSGMPNDFDIITQYDFNSYTGYKRGYITADFPMEWVMAVSAAEGSNGLVGQIEVLSTVELNDADIQWWGGGPDESLVLSASAGEIHRIPITSERRGIFNIEEVSNLTENQRRAALRSITVLPSGRGTIVVLTDEFFETLVGQFVGNYTLRCAYIEFLAGLYDAPPDEVLWVTYPGVGGAEFRVDVSGCGTGIDGIMRLTNSSLIEGGATLHELMHRWGNGILPYGARSTSTGEDPTLEPVWDGHISVATARSYKLDTTHWGFVSQLGQLGGFPMNHLVTPVVAPPWGMNAIAYRAHPAWFTLRSFGPTYFGTHTGNNAEPGPYSEVELFLAGLGPAPDRVLVSTGNEDRYAVTIQATGEVTEWVGHNGFRVYTPEDWYELMGSEREPITIEGYNPTELGWNSSCGNNQTGPCLDVAFIMTTPVNRVSMSMLKEFDEAVEHFTRGSGNGKESYNLWEATYGRAVINPILTTSDE